MKIEQARARAHKISIVTSQEHFQLFLRGQTHYHYQYVRSTTATNIRNEEINAIFGLDRHDFQKQLQWWWFCPLIRIYFFKKTSSFQRTSYCCSWRPAPFIWQWFMLRWWIAIGRQLLHLLCWFHHPWCVHPKAMRSKNWWFDSFDDSNLCIQLNLHFLFIYCTYTNNRHTQYLLPLLSWLTDESFIPCIYIPISLSSTNTSERLDSRNNNPRRVDWSPSVHIFLRSVGPTSLSAVACFRKILSFYDYIIFIYLLLIHIHIWTLLLWYPYLNIL